MQTGTFGGTPSEVTVYTPDETTSGYHCVTSNCGTALGSKTFNHDIPDDTSNMVMLLMLLKGSQHSK